MGYLEILGQVVVWLLWLLFGAGACGVAAGPVLLLIGWREGDVRGWVAALAVLAWVPGLALVLWVVVNYG